MSKIITVPFTEEFLPHVVDYVYRYYESRAGIYRVYAWFSAAGVRRCLLKGIWPAASAKLLCRPSFLPSTNGWPMSLMAHEVPVPGSDLDHCYTIYQLAMKLCPWVCQGRETFAQFLPWAREILHFIEQLDLEDVPLDSLKHIKEHAEIGFSVPEDINKLLMHLGVLRQAYHQQLEATAIGPAGLSIPVRPPAG